MTTVQPDEARAKGVRAAAWLLGACAVVAGLFTAYYWFDHRTGVGGTHMADPATMHGPGAGTGPGMMGSGHPKWGAP